MKPGHEDTKQIKAETKKWMNWSCFMILDLLKLIWYHLKVVELFISFPNTLKPSKSKFGAKSYVQNIKVCHVENRATEHFCATGKL
jgi:hypothetical protein